MRRRTFSSSLLVTCRPRLSTVGITIIAENEGREKLLLFSSPFKWAKLFIEEGISRMIIHEDLRYIACLSLFKLCESPGLVSSCHDYLFVLFDRFSSAPIIKYRRRREMETKKKDFIHSRTWIWSNEDEKNFDKMENNVWFVMINRLELISVFVHVHLANFSFEEMPWNSVYVT